MIHFAARLRQALGCSVYATDRAPRKQAARPPHRRQQM